MSDHPCPVCRADAPVALGAKRGHEYLRCGACRLIYAARLPTPEEFAASYGRYAAKLPSAWRVLRKQLKLWTMVRAARAARPGEPPPRFLDIGSNTGYNTEAARRLGCEAHGLEVNPGTIAIARRLFPGCHFHEQSLEQLAATGAKFDLVYCSEVIEHVPDPHSFSAALAAVTGPGGTLFITTPDAAHWRVPADPLAWSEVIPVQHLRLYDRANLERLLGEHGFRVVGQTPMLRANLRLTAVRQQV